MQNKTGYGDELSKQASFIVDRVKQASINKIAMDPTRRQSLINLLTIAGAGVGGLGGLGLGAHVGGELAKTHITPAETVKEQISGGRVENKVAPYLYGSAGAGALSGAALGGYTARQLAKLLLGSGEQKNTQITEE